MCRRPKQLFDFFTEWIPNADVFLSRFGIVPLSTWNYIDTIWSLYRALDVTWWSVVLLTLTVGATIAVLVGYKTRVSCFALWVRPPFFCLSGPLQVRLDAIFSVTQWRVSTY